jgi:hypothetical protein
MRCTLRCKAWYVSRWWFGMASITPQKPIQLAVEVCKHVQPANSQIYPLVN